jgi:hypothetical protein
MEYAYVNCTNLTEAVCGSNVTDMTRTYSNCTSLTKAVFGPKVSYIANAYYGCPLIQGNTYVFSKGMYTGSTTNRKPVRGCFWGRDNSNMLNIYVP